jgi:hypothetical protein
LPVRALALDGQRQAMSLVLRFAWVDVIRFAHVGVDIGVDIDRRIRQRERLQLRFAQLGPTRFAW